MALQVRVLASQAFIPEFNIPGSIKDYVYPWLPVPLSFCMAEAKIFLGLSSC